MDENWLVELLESVGNTPLLQGLVAALSTFVLEDPTTIGCGLLVADGKMGFLTAFIALSTGIALGDFGLYGIGRWLGPRVLERGWVSEARLQRARDWFRHNLVTAVLLSRFVPGMRLPTYLGAGVFEVSAVRFLGLAVGASVVWTFLLLSLTIELGQAVFPLLGRWRWPAALAVIATMIAAQWILGRRRGTRKKSPARPKPVSRFEFWPPWLFYIPVAFYYLWLSLRFRGPTLPTAANPGIYAGGFIGESKSEILELLADSHRHWLAAWIAHDRTRGVSARELLAEVRTRINQVGLSLPLVAKPDLGQRGAGVRPIRNWQELESYLHAFPDGERVIVQELIALPGEAGIFYYRRPGEEKGSVFSVTLKYFPSVRGDGERTLRSLILQDERAARIAPLYLRRHQAHLETVLDNDVEYPLVFAGNHCQGAVFKNGKDIVTAELRERFDEIAAALPEFYFGRFDLKFESLEELSAGRGFRIVEINGAGAEATHIWDADTGLREAYATLFRQFRILFEIGFENRRRGVQPLSLGQLLRDSWRYRKKSAEYPETM